ncbi:hypothetical protein EK21DRAFT_99455 [Setomelanomma holmii]|uniref:Uncharacterized protein n=1 Tax=Setomelanomma holmii TaxID=210430 RepID=A0A9P4HDQ3_9PLEO|nr:hypothetical protein EK21DRAFT_99455 [Setomelanomma holmii]
MKFSRILVALSASVNAQYSGDIVQYWVDQSGLLSNNTLIGGLQSPPSGWFEAIVQASIYVAALESKNESLAFQQLAVNFGNISKAAQDVLAKINITETDDRYWRAAAIGRRAVIRVTNARQDDKLNNLVNYVYHSAYPSVYQRTPGSAFVAPDTPQARYLHTFGGIGDGTRFRVPPPPSVNSSTYESFLDCVKAQGERNSTVRTAYNIETAYFWRESSPTAWNRFAHNVIGDKYAKDVLSSAEFYAQLNYAHANAAVAGWDSKAFYNTWRPVTAIRRTDIWLPSKRNNGGKDEIHIIHSTNATGVGLGVMSRRYTSIKQAVKNNGDSRIFGGIHFQFSSDVDSIVADPVGRATLEAFDKNWDKF